MKTARQPLTPMRQARMESLRDYIERSVKTYPVTVAKLISLMCEGEDAFFISPRTTWTRHELDTALNDLVRHGLARLDSDRYGIEVFMTTNRAATKEQE